MSEDSNEIPSINMDVPESADSPSKPKLDPLEIIHQMSIDGSDPTILQPIICPDSGQILGYEERWNLSAEIVCDASHSMSLNRAPDPEAFGMAIGKRGNLPFLPGGFENEIDSVLKQSESICGDDEQKFLDFTEILSTPPGFLEPVILPNVIEKSTKNSLPPGMAQMNSTVLDDLLSKDLSIETDQNAIEKLESSFKSVLLKTQDDIDETEPEIEKGEKTDITLIDEADDLTVQRESQSEYTYAKFLDESKVAKHYDENIRPIMAKTYPFELDMFQKQAIVSMEANDSVFVAAHTSAGKTVCAEYAIALSKIHKTRVIYTSPIKALSNQKYREFKILFEDVGLITGDVQINTDAFCLIMTTEVLRSMLYNGSEVIRELEWVIFDEVHYINDEERGYVWEESLIMLPSHVSIVMLSATVPNCVEFADWVGRIKQRQITVIQTLKRPVPLEHFIYTGHDGKSREELFQIMTKDGQLLNYGHTKAVQAKSKIDRPPDPRFQQQQQLQNQGSRNQQRGGGKAGKFQQHQLQAAARSFANGDKKKSNYAMDRSVYSNLTSYLKAKDLMPVVVFVFSRKRCDDNANMMQSADLTSQSEKHEIVKFFDRCIDRLSGSDKILPQVIRMKRLCERGFAVHHSGILPILKEVVELLFQRGLVKVLFATETFAMGVNMPARTVVFDAIEKFDGSCKRPLNATEYTQMAGRAGRRGLDDTGIVITLAKNSVPPIIAFTQLLTGKAVSLDSRFRVTYAMLLKLLRVEQFRIEDMLQRSYVERSSLRLVVSRKKQIGELNDQIKSLPASDCEECLKSGPGSTQSSINELFYDLTEYFKSLSINWNNLMGSLTQKLLVKGRVIVLNYPPLNLTGKLGVVLQTKYDEHGRWNMVVFIPAIEQERDIETIEIKAFGSLSQDEREHRIKKLQIFYAAMNGLFAVKPQSKYERSYRVVYDFEPRDMLAICKKTVKTINVDAILNEDRKRVPTARPRSPDTIITRTLTELDGLAEKYSISGPEVYEFGTDIKEKELTSYDQIQNLIAFRDKLLVKDNYPCLLCPLFANHFASCLDRDNLNTKLVKLTHLTSEDALLLSQEYLRRIHVLKTLDYIDKTNMISLKGKIACEISHLEVLVTELLFENKFDGKSCAEIAAMISPMTCQFTFSGSKERDRNMEFAHGINYLLREEVVNVAERIDHIQQTCQVCNSFLMDELRFGLMDVVYEWASGKEFSKIMELTDCQEGIIVRCIQRLDEVLKDIRNAARIIGNPVLYDKMEETSSIIKRDIIFTASLYTTNE